MNEAELQALITQGEGSQIEFKRSIDLSSARGKAEFIKDIAALANTATDVSYMLVGVENDRTIVGATDLPEEQIQQIAQVYINPTANLKCISVAMTRLIPLTIGVIEVRPTDKPHKVSRAIENLTQNKVFVRHGTVVVEASPEEMFAMRDEFHRQAEIRQYARAAETHMKLGNWDNAIKAFSHILEISPTAEIFLSRGNAYLQKTDALDDVKVAENYARLAQQDLTHAIRLGLSTEGEKVARFYRARSYVKLPSACHTLTSDEYRFLEEDLSWLRENLQGRELGYLLVFEFGVLDFEYGYMTTKPDEAYENFSRALDLGYQEPEAYYYKAFAAFWGCNYGIAFNDISKAIESSNKKTKMLSDFYELRAIISVRMSPAYHYRDKIRLLDQAYSDLLMARKLSQNKFPPRLGYLVLSPEEIIYRYTLDYAFGGSLSHETKDVIQTLLKGTSFEAVNRRYPKIAYIINEIVGNNFWQMSNSSRR